MKKKRLFKGLALFGSIAFGVIVLSSCTANFCSDLDKANIMYSYDTGSTRYTDNLNNIPTSVTNIHKYNDSLYAYQDFTFDYKDETNSMINTVVSSATSSMIVCPSNEYWFKLDDKVLTKAVETWNNKYTGTDKGNYSLESMSVDQTKNVLTECGYVKFSGTDNTLWGNWTTFNKELISVVGIDNVPCSDFVTVYQSAVNTKVNNVRSCISLTGGTFGNFGYNHNKVQIEAKSWGYAWSKGFLEGLLVYPVGFLVETFSHSFGMGGWGQLGAILLVTFIVRTVLLLVSFKSTIAQQKMQLLQPELAKIQAKYPNSNTNQMQKQRLAQEQMALYKKNKINPFGQLIVLIVQFPLFIAVWGAMQGSSALATDAVLNLHLSDSILDTLKNTSSLPGNSAGWWTALILFIIMSLFQFLSMKLPQWMAKAREKKMPKLHANPAGDKSQRTMKWVGYIMLVMIIFMGLTLPAGMGVYWFAGALFSIIQTVITQMIINKDFQKIGHAIAGLFKHKSKGSNNDVIEINTHVHDDRDDKKGDK